MSINEIQDEIIEEFSYMDDWMEKYERIIALGKKVPLIDEQYKKDEYLISGCQSQVWLHAEKKEDIINFTADSDAIITKGLIALMVSVLSGQKARDIAHADIYFVDRIGLHSHLSPTRSNGLRSMLQKMKEYSLTIPSK